MTDLARSMQNVNSAASSWPALRLWSVLACACLVFPSVAVADCAPVDDPWVRLAVAIREGRHEQLDCLLADNRIDAHDPGDIWEHTPLHIAAKYDQPSVVQYLIDKGAQPNPTDAAGKTPLLVAVQHDSSDAAAVLILSGADIEAEDYPGKTPLYWAVVRKNIAIANLLLTRGANRQHVVDIGEAITIEVVARRSSDSQIRELFATPKENTK